VVTRLIVDHVRRSPGPYVWCGLLLALIWPGVGAGMLSAGTGLAVSMAIAFYIGPLVTGVFFPPRPVLVLPVSSRQIWVAKWLLSTVGASIWTTLAKLAGMAGAMAFGGPTTGLSLVALSALCDLAYTGALLGMLPVLHATPRGPLAVRRITLWAKLMLAVLAISSVVWVLVYRTHLPGEWADLFGVAGVVLLAALALTIAGYRYTPPAGESRGVSRGISRSPAPQATERETTPARVAILNRFTGIGYFLWRDAILWSGVAAGTLVVLYVVILVGPARGEQSAATELLVGFSEPLRAFPYLESGWVLLLVLSCFQAILPLPSRRLLRTLPLSTSGLNALVLSVSVVRWLINGLVVAAMFVLLAGSLPPVHWGVILWFLGLTALAHAIQLRSAQPHRYPAAFLLLGVLAVGILARGRGLPMFEAFLVAYPLNVLLAGGVTLLIAALLNHLTLTRRHAIYRPAPLEQR
jgi:hypothetical protein